MATGVYRTTEGGDQRVLENSVDLRVTENYLGGEVNLTASSGFNFTANLVIPATLSVNATSTLSVNATLTSVASSSTTANSTLQASGARTTSGTSDLNATSNVSAVVKFKGAALSNLVASSNVNATSRVVKYVTVLSGDIQFDRITENEDSRVTENGDTRVTQLIRTNIVESTMVASANLIPFSSLVYIRQNGEWKLVFDVDANVDSVWKNTEKIYRNIAGTWKRIY